MATILLVDGDREFRSTCAEDLAREGHQVVTASNGCDALRLIRERRPDVVVSELYLPGGEGPRMLAELLNTKARPLVVLNSAASYRRDPFLSWAADAELRKSTDTSELRKTLAAMLQPAWAA